MDCVQALNSGGFKLRLDMRIYSKPAVLKVLYRWTNQYAVALSRAPRAVLTVEMEPLIDAASNAKSDANRILNELAFEMLRGVVIKQTSDIRSLLVGRALYATCIEIDKATADKPEATPLQNWEDDEKRILESWSDER